MTYPSALVPGTPVMYRCILYGRHITADIVRTTKTAISRQISSAGSSRLLRPNLLIETQRPKASPDRFIYKKAAKIKKRPLVSRDIAVAGYECPGAMYPVIYRYLYIYIYTHVFPFKHPQQGPFKEPRVAWQSTMIHMIEGRILQLIA